MNKDIQAEFKAEVPVLDTEFRLQNYLIAARRDLYIQAGALFNDTLEPIKRTTFWGEEVSHLPSHYYLNGIGDITEEQMQQIYSNREVARMLSYKCSDLLCCSKLRTILPISDMGNSRFFYNGESILSNSDVEVMNATEDRKVFVKWRADFGWATKLVAIKDVLDLSEYHYNFMHTEGLANLKYIMLANAHFNIELKDSPLLLKECVLFAIENFCNEVSENHSIVLHPEVYAKCNEGGEWHKDIMAALNAKNQQMVNGGSINIASA